MNFHQLTRRARTANSFAMNSRMAGERSGKRRSLHRGVAAVVMLMAGTMAVSGCISVNAPDKPIVIELNINIKQEVIYRLSADAGNTIDSNKEIF